jgi:chromosome segregation protein
MYLKRLELQGYKTFAARTEFEFDSGITAIVGPNGSGKSNIADALRWVMGEQRYSTLRAKRGEDMVFAGSQGRKSMGMAEVSLTLDNSSGWLPIDYAEVRVQRRTFRSGDTEYYLNSSRARRKDIVELLAKGGLSSNTYTVIGQGAVDAALNMRPEERRAIFEEAAGIAIYQARRDESLTKLEATRSNIMRVNDIINEITPRLNSLRKQAERADEYQKVAAESEEANRAEALRRHKRGLEEIAEKIEELRQRQAELRGQLSDWHSESGALHAGLEELQRELAVIRERERLLTQQREEIRQDLSPLEASRDVRGERIAELEAELKQLATERQEREAEAEGLRGQLAQLEEERGRVDQELATAQDRAFQLATELAEGRNRLNQLAERKEQLGRENAEHDQEIERLEEQAGTLRGRIEGLEAERDTLLADGEELSSRQAEMERTAQSSLARQRELRPRWEKVGDALSKLEARHELLTKVRQELTGYTEGVRTVLAHKSALEGLVATVAEVLEVPSHLELAVETALGSLLQAVIVETWQAAEKALRFLEESHGGQATFLPLDSLETSLMERVPEGEGIVGLASELIGIRDGLGPALTALLGDTLVVRDLATAHLVRREHGSLRVVTLSGQLVCPRGSVTGGSAESGGGLLARERELRELPEEIAEARASKKGLEEEIHTEEEGYQEVLSEVAALGQEQQQLEARRRAKEEEIASWRLRRDRVAQEIEWRKAAQRRLQREMESLEERRRAVTEEIEGGERNEHEVGEAIESLQEALARLDVSLIQGQLSEVSTALAVLERSRQSQEDTLRSHRGSLEQLEGQIAAKESRVAELTAEAEGVAERVAVLGADIEELSGRLETLSATVEPAEDELASLEAKQLRLQRDEVRQRRALERYEAAYNTSLIQRQRAQDELGNLRERIEADLEATTLSASVSGETAGDVDARLKSLPEVTEVPEGLEREIKELRARLRRIGPVNVEAPSEYEEVLDRHTFLISQVEDLEDASQSLRKVVAELDRTMRERFVATFEQVGREFESYFTRLFNGGKGHLVLTDPENPLQSGVEILTQPPGRRQGTVSVLSGGERSLTGVALTFAILKACGTPFCFLDEVDSQLDEVNIGRFREALRELGEKTQIIVITHNRGTVECADAIYGITMATDSTSRVLSLRLDQVEAQAS